jgi:hypothetical protein
MRVVSRKSEIMKIVVMHFPLKYLPPTDRLIWKSEKSHYNYKSENNVRDSIFQQSMN